MTKWYISLDTIDSTISWHNHNIFHRLRQNIVFAVRDFTFHDALRRLPMTIDNRKLWHGFSQILLPEGKGRFCLIRTEYRGHSTAAIYLCIAEK